MALLLNRNAVCELKLPASSLSWILSGAVDFTGSESVGFSFALEELPWQEKKKGRSSRKKNFIV